MSVDIVKLNKMRILFDFVLVSHIIFIIIITSQKLLFAQLKENIDPAVFLQVQKQDQILSDNDTSLFVTVLRKELNDKPVSSLLPGYLFEMGYGDMESGLWAEMIFNRQFELFPPYKPGRDWWYGLRKKDKEKERTDLQYTDWREMEWYHSGYEHNSWYAAPGEVDDYHIDEKSTFFQLENNESTAKIELLTINGFLGQYARVKNTSSKNGQGIAQNGKYLRKGIGYTFKGYFRKVDKESDVTVSLYPYNDWGKPIVTAKIRGLNNKWQNTTLHFMNPDYEGFATLMISVNANSAVDMDALSLMPDDAMNGWRKDVVEKVRNEVKPKVMRWPGGCYASYYQWKDGSGERDKRPVKVSGHWGGFAYNDVGTLEYIDFCEKTGAERFICLNLFHPRKEKYLYYFADTKTGSLHGYYFPEFTNLERGAQLAAEWVAYCNLPAGAHPMADLRAKHGRKKPGKVLYWELENEAWRWFSSAGEYAKACVIYAKAMKKVDPTIKLGICTYGKQLSDGLDSLLEIAGMYIDFLADREISKDNIDRKIGIVRDYNKKHKTNIRYANTEYLAESLDPVTTDALKIYDIPEGKGRNLVTATWGYSLSLANLFMQWQRYGGDVIFTCFNSLVNDHLNSVIETPKEGVFLRYPAVIGKLFSKTPSCWLLDLIGYEPDARKTFQVQVAWDKNRTNLVVYLFNSNSEAKEVSLNLNELSKSFKYLRASYVIGPALETIRSVKVENTMIEANNVIKDIDLKNGIWNTSAPPRAFVQIELSENPFN
jgi:alpha-L-arabinofuranosidase